MKILKFLLLFIYISISFNELTPDINNAVLLSEYDIKCITGTTTYKINNYQAKNYLHLIKNSYINEFELFDENKIKIDYSTNTKFDYFYYISLKKILYLVIKTYLNYCISFKFHDSNSISFQSNEEYKYPIVVQNQYLETVIYNNVSNNHFIFNLKHSWATNPNAGYYIYINNIKYFAKSGVGVFSKIINENKINVKIELPGVNIVASLSYMSIPYSNITEDTLMILNSSYIFHSIFINKPKKDTKYFWYTLSSNKIEFYDNNEFKSSLSDIVNYVDWNNRDYFILVKDIGAFQIQYLTQNSYIIIKEDEPFLISTTKEYSFKYKDDSKKDLILSLYSKEKNFINKIIIDSKQKDLNIIYDNTTYYYRFNLTNKYGEIPLKINFNLNSSNYIFIIFGVVYYTPPKSEPFEEKKNYTVVYVFVSIAALIVLIVVIYFIIKCYKNYRRAKIIEERDIERENKRRMEIEKIKNCYQLIKDDFSKLKSVCFICLDIVENYNYIDIGINDEKDVINDINTGKFRKFLDYIEPKKCRHHYHPQCLNFYEDKKRYLEKPQKCKFCKMFLTVDNFKKFGCFIDEKTFFNIIKNFQNYLQDEDKDAENKLDKNRKNFFKILKDKLYQEVENSRIIYEYKKNNLIKIKNFNEKYFIYFSRLISISLSGDKGTEGITLNLKLSLII